MESINRRKRLMPIKDIEVDLTSYRMFRDKDTEYLHRHCRQTADKLFTVKRARIKHPAKIDKVLRRLELPWVKRESEVTSEDKFASKQVRSYDDPFSDSLQVTFRTTSSNTFLQFGDPNAIIRNEDVLEEIFLEEYGYIPLASVTRCFECGKYVLHPVGEICFSCSKCMSKPRKAIPWFPQ